VLVAGLAPAAAHAAAPAAPPAAKITKADTDKGMKEAPAVLADGGVTCSVVNARFIGTLTLPPDPKVKDSKPSTVNGYEVACKEGGGYSMLTTTPKPLVQDCIASASNAVLACRLPENGDPKASLNPVMIEAGRTCTVADAKYLGATGAGVSFYEVTCKPGEGYILQREPGKPAIANPCLGMAESKLACTNTTLDAAKTYTKSLAAGVKKPCAITDVRFVGTTSSGFDGYEAACGPDAGYMFTVNNQTGALGQQVDCSLAASFLGGCKLVDTSKAETQESKIYSSLAKKAGFPCDVNKYRLIGTMAGNTDVVELACANRADGAVGAFGEDAAKTKIYDCVQIGELGQECKLGTSKQPVFDKLSASLAAKGKGSCKVSNARFIGAGDGGASFYETACSDGGSGWVVRTTGVGYTADSLTPCAVATGQVACKLPGNVKK
jgi:hypothetical protein